MLALVRRWAFVPMLIVTIISLVVNEGGSALQICFNSVAILCTYVRDRLSLSNSGCAGLATDCDRSAYLQSHARWIMWRIKLAYVRATPAASHA